MANVKLPEPVFRNLAVTNLHFDPDNPRLPSWVDGTSPEAVMLWMLEDATLLQLMGSIGAQNYFPGEPILVVPWKKQPEQYMVVEGNRRVAAVRLLASPQSAPSRKKAVEEVAASSKFRPKDLPAAIFPRRDEIVDYLGYRHVTGIKEWGPLEKARYVQQLLAGTDPRPQVLSEIARKIGSRRDYIARLLAAAAVYDHVIAKRFYGLNGVDERSFEFSLLSTALAYEHIYRFIGMRSGGEVPPTLNGARVKELISWVYAESPEGQTVLGESRRLGLLAAVVANDRAVQELRKTRSLDHAARFTRQPLASFRGAIEESISSAETAIQLLGDVDATETEDKERSDRLGHVATKVITEVANRLGKRS